MFPEFIWKKFFVNFLSFFAINEEDQSFKEFNLFPQISIHYTRVHGNHGDHGKNRQLKKIKLWM